MSAFLHGKLPAHGDFVSRGLAPDERDLVDGWLAASLASARDALGAGFEAAFDAAPPWRFAWRDGARWTAGALAPSADAVGRRYPILIGRRDLLATDVHAGTAALDQLLYAAIAEGWDADRLEREAADLILAGDGPDVACGGSG